MAFYGLVGGLEHFLFSHILGIISPNWRSYFSEGWPNHQPVVQYLYFRILKFPLILWSERWEKRHVADVPVGMGTFDTIVQGDVKPEWPMLDV